MIVVFLHYYYRMLINLVRLHIKLIRFTRRNKDQYIINKKLMELDIVSKGAEIKFVS